ncbi:MAG: hypothetical protein ACKV2T_03915 [Kofleriaceae bacterium]
MNHFGLLVGIVALVSSSACGSNAKEREAYAVGGWVGTDSVFGPGPRCTYEITPPSAADMGETKTSGKLVAPGTGKMTCESGYTEEFDIVAADKMTIDGEHKISVGKEGSLRVSMFGGRRELKTNGHWVVDWTVPAACDAIVKHSVDTPAGADSLRGSYRLEMTGLAKGTCTVTASALGQTQTRVITVQ